MLQLKGKDYLPVAERLIWFREERPDWSIETEIKPTDTSCLGRAVIKNEKGVIIATAHKFENVKGFGDFIEKSETGAIGRALALCGFGTQFCADDLNEHDRIVDSPRDGENVAPRAANDRPFVSEVRRPESGNKMQTAGDYVITFGKSKGKKISELNAFSLNGLVKFCKYDASPDFRERDDTKQFIFWAESYLKRTSQNDLDKALDNNQLK